MVAAPRQPSPTASVRQRSEALFGQACKLEVIDAIARADREIFSLADILPSAEYRSRYHKVLQDLCLAGLLERLPKDKRNVPYRRVPSALWQWARDYIDD